MATAVIRRLHLIGFPLLVLEQPEPTCIRRPVCLAEAVYDQKIAVEGVKAKLVDSIEAAISLCKQNRIPILIDPDGKLAVEFGATICVDARLMKREIDPSDHLAPMVIGLGPGFTVGENCQVVVETNRGHNLGRVLYTGAAEADTGQPGLIAGVSGDRLIKATADGQFISSKQIGELVQANEIIGAIGESPVKAKIAGVLRGLIRDGATVTDGMKIGDVDPRGIKEFCYTISDKANAIAGGVVEAVLRYSN